MCYKVKSCVFVMAMAFQRFCEKVKSFSTSILAGNVKNRVSRVSVTVESSRSLDDA